MSTETNPTPLPPHPAWMEKQLLSSAILPGSAGSSLLYCIIVINRS